MDSNKRVDDFKFMFAVPLSIKVGRKNKLFIMNLNNYRNAHFRVLNDAKRNFNDHIENMGLINFDIPIQNPVRMHYYYYPASKRSYDRMNVLSVIDKFACDALVKCGILVDDNYKMVLTPTFKHVRVDRKNPRCEIFITEES